MDLNEAQQLARELMDKHGLHDWSLEVSVMMTRTFGECKSHTKTITLSGTLTAINEITEVRDTILHEIAHALREKERGHVSYRLSGEQWHDYRWKVIAAEIGAKPKRYYIPKAAYGTVTTPQKTRTKPTWKMTCPNCKRSGTANRKKSNLCCGMCHASTGQYFQYVYDYNI